VVVAGQAQAAAGHKGAAPVPAAQPAAAGASR
jgi:hypothetical protein